MLQLAKIAKFFIAVYTFVVLGLLFVLSYYNCPSILDDYCFAYTAKAEGFWTSQILYYNGWTGRYFGTFWCHINPLYFTDARYPFILFPIVIILAFVFNIQFLLKSIFQNDNIKTNVIFLTLAFVCLYFIEIQNIAETIYWMSGNYTFASVNLVILFLALYFKYENATVGKRNALFGVLAVVYFLLLGSSEVSMLCTTAFVFLLIFISVIKNKKLTISHIILIVISIIGNYLVISAPGNAIRNPAKKDILETLVSNLFIMIDYVLRWTLDSPLLIVATVAYILFLMNVKIKNELFKTPLYISLSIYIIIVYIGFIPTSYGMGTFPPSRIQNMIYLFFLLGWFYHITVFGAYFKAIQLQRLQLPLQLVVIVMATFLVFKNESLRDMYRDLKYNKAQAYLVEYEVRTAKLRDAESKVVYLKLFENKPTSLYVGDFNKDPKSLWNRCLGDYYNHKTIYLDNAKP